MSQTSKRLLVLVLPLAMAVAAGVGLLSREFAFGGSASGNSSETSFVSRLSGYRIPDSLNFCGEAMPLAKEDVRERMEQAFYTELSDAQIILDLKRSGEYFPYIEQKLREMNLPGDLKYLAVAESALRNLVSYRDAAGIWQFTPETARRYGLKINYYVDERFNFTKSTDAALRCLSDLHSMLGSWTLAAAAYNMGTNGIKRTVNYQMTDDYYKLFLNDETSRFVFRIVALKQIMSHYKSYGFDLQEKDFYKPADVRTVTVKYLQNLAAWARQQGTDLKEVKYLNPWLISDAVPLGTWSVDLPAVCKPPIFASPALLAVDSSSSATSRLAYVVKRGDSLTKIAETYGVSIRDLIQWNSLEGDTYLRAGQKLIIIQTDANFVR